MNTKEIHFDTKKHTKEILSILQCVQEELGKEQTDFSREKLRRILNRFPQNGNSLFSRGQLVTGYRYLVEQKVFPEDKEVLEAIRMKPVRTQSGVTPVTVLTKPFPCPGKCIFCPNDIRMPKSYLSNEPGAQRAERNHFDPYLQTYNRLLAFHNIGHNTNKVELIILGGTWSFYPEYYQIWFVKRCFDAMNDFGIRDDRANVQIQSAKKKSGLSDNGKTYNQILMDVAKGRIHNFFEKYEHAGWEELYEAQKINENALCRNVGLVIETRPDYITEKEVLKIRKLGATKVQIGIQSMNDTVLKMNKRGHDVAATKKSFILLRLAGFKIHAHWMPNLYGSDVDNDISDYKKLWTKDFRPDELKIYPTSIIENTQLFSLYKKNNYHPYTHDELLSVFSHILPMTPRYVRLTRIIRDIPSTDIVAGNKTTNFREVAEKAILSQGHTLKDIRSREIKLKETEFKNLKKEIIEYTTGCTREYFISYLHKKDDSIAGFLRLSLPQKKLSQRNFMLEIQNCAMIREVHVYGQVVGLGETEKGKAQHLGLGKKLIEHSEHISKKNGWKKLAVISAIGTREYYRKRGFSDLGLYLVKNI